jgi:hypothetical protein
VGAWGAGFGSSERTQAILAIEASRFSSLVPGCSQGADPYGMWLVQGGGMSPPASLPFPASFAATWSVDRIGATMTKESPKPGDMNQRIYAAAQQAAGLGDSPVKDERAVARG